MDHNRTVWQRLNDHLLPLLSREEAEIVTSYLHPYVIAERNDARRAD
jgi:hypothetical protein